MHDVIRALAASLPYELLILFFGLYPMVSALMWIGTSLIFFRRERGSENGDAFDDGSPDSTLAKARSYLLDERVRIDTRHDLRRQGHGT